MKASAQTLELSRGRNLTAIAFLVASSMLRIPAIGQVIEATVQNPTPAGQTAPAAQTSPPLTLTLQEAIERARANEPQFRSAVTDYKVAKEDKLQAFAALLPAVTQMTEYLYTQPPTCSSNSLCSGMPPAPVRFVANNFPHEYISQLNAHEAIGLTQIAQFRHASAAAAVARAKSELAARGLVVTVVSAYYGLLAAEKKYATAQQASREADQFLDITRKLEQGGEVARSDTIKAQVQANDKRRNLYESQLAMEQARTGLAVLLFPDFNQNFTVIDDSQPLQALPSAEEIQQMALRNNPQLQSVAASLRVARRDVTAAWGGHLPSLSLDYWYGIDAAQFAVNNREGFRNLGYAYAATLNIPVWSWGATQSKVKQAVYRREQARLELSFAQRQLLGNIQNFYHEAEVSSQQLQLLQESAQLADQSLRLTTLRYQSGEATVLEVVDAQNTLAQARSAYSDSQVRYRTAIAKLQTLTGAF